MYGGCHAHKCVNVSNQRIDAGCSVNEEEAGLAPDPPAEAMRRDQECHPQSPSCLASGQWSPTSDDVDYSDENAIHEQLIHLIFVSASIIYV